MLASWVMGNPFVIVHVYPSPIVPLVGAFESVKLTIETTMANPKLLAGESLSFFPRYPTYHFVFRAVLVCVGVSKRLGPTRSSQIPYLPASAIFRHSSLSLASVRML